MELKYILIILLIALGVLYISFGIFLFIKQKSMLYYPNDQDFENCEGFKDYEKITYQGTRMYFKKNSLENVVVYYHGNAGSACDRSRFKSVFEQSGSSIIFVEYAGYSNDNQEPSKELILKDVENTRNFIKKESFTNVVLYGQSLGSGAASYHAFLGDVNSLILVTPFSNLEDIVQSNYTIYPTSILLKEKYDNEKWLKNFGGDVVVIHGDQDMIIPYKFSQKLFNNLTTEKKEYVLIKNIGHNDIWFSKIFTRKLSEYINKFTKQTQ